ncbi:MAG: LuxR C-terminal-related transcriptional regulator [Christiangramia sp.]|nr:LuxR C-terminal-related transcriptional regulator [Christiangramia sp.]
MKIYESDYLIIQYEKENDRFVQFWKASPPSFDILKEELLTYTGYYKKHRPSQALWLQQNFCLPLNKEIDEWIEENVNIPCVECGNEKVAFVVGKDVLVHLSVMNSFEEMSSVVSPNHFASEQEARQWLDETDTEDHQNSEMTILFEGIDEDGNSIIKIKRPSGDIVNTIRSFNNLLEENKFIKSNIENYSKLTKREKEILVVFSKGLKQQEIADELYISVQTLRTHWKNIKKKLGIRSLAEVIKYVQAFEMK